MGTEKRERQKAARQQKIQELRKHEQRDTMKHRGLLIGGLIAVFVIGAIVYSVMISGDGDDDDAVASDDTTADDAATDDTSIDGDATDPGCQPSDLQFDSPPEMEIDPAKTYTASMVTDMGTIEIELYAEKAPVTVNSFVFLARQGFYDCISFHRVIPDFVVQGGDPQGTGSGGPGYNFEDELPEPDEYQAGSLAMANSGPNTNGSQFFIVTSDNGAQSLVDAVGGTANYSLFGQVTEGMDVVAEIEADGSPGGTPSVLHRIETVTITES